MNDYTGSRRPGHKSLVKDNDGTIAVDTDFILANRNDYILIDSYMIDGLEIDLYRPAGIEIVNKTYGKQRNGFFSIMFDRWVNRGDTKHMPAVPKTHDVRVHGHIEYEIIDWMI